MGRQIILATGSDERFAKQVADHLKLFDLVLASDGVTNLSGKLKRARLVGQFGKKVSITLATNLATWLCGLRRGKLLW